MTYNCPFMTLDKACRLATTYIRSGIIPVLISPPGVGKTAMARKVAGILKADFRPIRLNNISPEEVAGLQYIDREGRHSIHLPPKWMPNPDGTDGPVLVFIDEITQASDENRKAIMSALLEGYLGDTQLPGNCWFMAAGNSSEDGTNVYEFDRATADRLGFIQIVTDVEAWCNDYAPTVNEDVTVPTFLRLREDAFEMSAEMQKGDEVIGPSPRSWEAVMRFVVQAEKDGLDEDEIICGVKGKVGEGIGEAYKVVRDQAMQLKTIRELVAMEPDERKMHAPKTIDALWTYCQGMIFYATDPERTNDVFSILDSFEEIEDVPFYEMRQNVAEIVLGRVTDVYGYATISADPRIGRAIARWKAEVKRQIAQDAATEISAGPEVLEMRAAV